MSSLLQNLLPTFVSQLTKDLYIFSGLGADERVFQNLDFPGYNPVFIKWIVPLPNESMHHYAGRLLEQIESPKPILLGLSFGGMIAVEVAKYIDTEKLILISTAKTQKEIPFYYRMAGQLGLHKIIPPKLLKNSNFVSNWIFGTSSAIDKKLLKQILLDTDPDFLKWAIDKVLRWSNQKPPKNAFHIHGSSDRILPLRFVNCDIIVPDGGHFMVLNKSEEVNALLRLYL